MTHSTEHKHDSPRTPRATYQDVLDAPEHRVAEIVDGTLHVSPRPPTLAALAKTRLSAGLGRAFDRGRDGPGGWWIFHEPELHFGEDVLVTGWRRERMPKLPDTDYVILAPDWACEVLSPATRRLDLVDTHRNAARLRSGLRSGRSSNSKRCDAISSNAPADYFVHKGSLSCP